MGLGETQLLLASRIARETVARRRVSVCASDAGLVPYAGKGEPA